MGTSGLRLCLVDDQNDIQGSYVRAFGPEAGKDWINTWSSSIHALLAEIPASSRKEIEGIAIDGTSATALLVDRKTGQVLTPAKLYNEAQGPETVAFVKSIAPANHTTTASTSALCKLAAWVLDGTVDRLRAGGHDPILLHQADWAAALLHGDYSGVSDWNNALKLGFEPSTLSYGDWLSDHARLSPLLPREVLAPGTVQRPVSAALRQTLGLASGCSVIAGTTDSIAAFIACSGGAPGAPGSDCAVGDAVTSLGSTLAIKLISSTPVDDARYGVYSHRLGDTWLVGGASNAGGAVLRTLFTDAALVELTEKMDAAKDTGLDYYPLNGKGERFPTYDPNMEPRLTPRPAEDHVFLQGIFEGLARIEARAFALLTELGATPVSRVRTAGGGSRNPVWTALRQRYLGSGVRVERAGQSEAAYGAALLAKGGATAARRGCQAQ